jgi:hypothetical protein
MAVFLLPKMPVLAFRFLFAYTRGNSSKGEDMRLRAAIFVGLLMAQFGGWLLLPAVTLAGSSGVYISELQTGGATGRPNDEFVELYNASSTDVALKGWQLEYRAATTANGTDCTKGWTKTAALPDTVIKAHRYFLLADRTYPVVANAQFSFDMSSTSGTVHVLDGTKHVVDAVAWGDDTPCGSGHAVALGSGQSAERLPGAQVPTGGNGYDTGDNARDFVVRSSAEPQAAAAPAELPLAIADTTQGDAVGRLELSELLPSPGDGQNQFIELHNVSDTAVVAHTYTLQIGAVQYRLPNVVILPGAYFALTPEAVPFTLPAVSGQVQLKDAADQVLSAVSWADSQPGSSIIMGADTWPWTTTITPGAANVLTLPPGEPAGRGDGGTVAPSALELSELLPDPAAPASDASDEMIELHNPNSYPVNLTGYRLKVGATGSDAYDLPDVTVAAGGYAAFTSAETGLALSNSGSRVVLAGPGGQVFDDVSYPAAKSGEAWARFAAGWQWTTTPTPGAINLLTGAGAVAKTAAAAKASKTTAAKAAKPTKAAVAKASASKAAKPKSKAVASKGPLAGTVASGPWLLFILAGLTICYGIYEFRYDLRSYYHRLRGYPKLGRATGPAASGRGDDRASQRPGRGQDDLRAGAGPRPRLQW